MNLRKKDTKRFNTRRSNSRKLSRQGSILQRSNVNVKSLILWRISKLLEHWLFKKVKFVKFECEKFQYEKGQSMKGGSSNFVHELWILKKLNVISTKQRGWKWDIHMN